MIGATRSRRQLRGQSGQMLVGGTAFFVVLSAVVVLLLLMLVNLNGLGGQRDRLAAVANQAARQYAANEYWLGMKRKEFDERQTYMQVLDSVNFELAALGLPKTKRLNVNSHEVSIGERNKIKVVEVSFVAGGIPLLSGGIMPDLGSMEVHGIATDSEHAMTKHAMALIHVVDPDTGFEKGLRVPCYNVTDGNSHALSGGLKTGPWIGNNQTAYLQIQCPNVVVANPTNQ